VLGFGIIVKTTEKLNLEDGQYAQASAIKRPLKIFGEDKKNDVTKITIRDTIPCGARFQRM
jgi:hypothetical protein